MGLFNILFNNKQLNTKKVKPEQRDAVEVQVIDLIHLVETENRHVFAELIAYTGLDKTRHLKTHVDINSESEKEKNNLYFNSLQNIINTCNELKSRTGNMDTDSSFVITDCKKINIENIEVIQVSMNYCLSDEVKCIDNTCFFDFVRGEKEYLLIDIDKSELYKKTVTDNDYNSLRLTHQNKSTNQWLVLK